MPKRSRQKSPEATEKTVEIPEQEDVQVAEKAVPEIVQVPEGEDAEEEDDDDDDFGPMPVTAQEQAKRKKRKVLPHEKLYLDHLPSADRYSRSFMHRDHLYDVTVSRNDFVMTSSEDGHLKFWKKQEKGIEFVKHYRAHLGAVTDTACSADGTVFATVSDDERELGAKIFDVDNFDMINVIKLDYKPQTCCWIHQRGQARSLLAISDQDSSKIRIYDGKGESSPITTLEQKHKAPVHIIIYSDIYNIVISADTSGMIEYWSAADSFDFPNNIEGLWEYKTTTDLYDFKKSKSTPLSLSLSPDSQFFASFSIEDRQIRIFHFLNGKLARKYDESLTAAQEMQQSGTAVYKLDEMEFGRRLAVERELEKLPRQLKSMNVVWDETGKFLLYPTLFGIKVVNTITNKVSRLLGKDETIRFMNLNLYQGLKENKAMRTLATAASDNPLLQKQIDRDPTLFCTAYKRPRFYMFTKEEPKDDKYNERDSINEKPTADEKALATADPQTIVRAKPLGSKATIYTEMGDISLELYPKSTPKTAENFAGLSRKGYYNSTIIHRIIPKFMIQMGDPLGNGTGGTSIWGREFEDEFRPNLKFDKPYMLAMANAGPNTNGSQFFITTVPCHWLDQKHTIFGRVLSGFEVLQKMEIVRTGKKNDKPEEDIKIISIEVS